MARDEISMLLFLLAERQGFEPWEARASTVFKTAAFDHSATSPSSARSVPHVRSSRQYFAIFPAIWGIYHQINCHIGTE